MSTRKVKSRDEKSIVIETEQQIKIVAKMVDGSQRDFYTTSFDLYPVTDNTKRLYVELDDGYTFFCKDVHVVQINGN